MFKHVTKLLPSLCDVLSACCCFVAFILLVYLDVKPIIMYPRSIKIHHRDTLKTFIYTPGHSEDTFNVYDIDDPKMVVIFDFDPINKSFTHDGTGIDKFEKLIGETILYNEYSNFRG